jgi:hypothetical protein
MRLPIQSQPVHRTIPSHPFADRGLGGAADGGRGVQPNDVRFVNKDSDVAWLKALKVPIFTTIPISPMPVF